MTDPSPAELAGTARRAIDSLAASGDPDAFRELLALSAHVGEALGIAARGLAAAGSWASVAGVAGTSRQAAWQRWSG